METTVKSGNGRTDYKVEGTTEERIRAMLEAFFQLKNGSTIKIIQGHGLGQNGKIVPAMGLLFDDREEPFGLTLEEADLMVERLKAMHHNLPDLYDKFGGPSLLMGLSKAAQKLRVDAALYDEANAMGVLDGNLGKTVQ